MPASAASRIETPFALDVRRGLRASPKRLPPAWFYDELGSALFDAITLLPEYGLTRADERLLAECAPKLGRYAQVAELGSGSGVKTRGLLEGVGARHYYPIDVSTGALERCRKELVAVCAVHPIQASFLAGLSRVPRDRGRLLLLFLGSTIGNFDRAEAEIFLKAVRTRLRPGDAFLLGVDLVKPVDQLLAAYDDPTGVTAAFNKNVLARMNRELGTDFDLAAFAHEARWVAEHRRIEMHLRALRDMEVRAPALRLRTFFDEGETLWTECSHKFDDGEMAEIGRRCGFRLKRQWVDREWPFAECLLAAV